MRSKTYSDRPKITQFNVLAEVDGTRSDRIYITTKNQSQQGDLTELKPRTRRVNSWKPASPQDGLMYQV